MLSIVHDVTPAKAGVQYKYVVRSTHYRLCVLRTAYLTGLKLRTFGFF